MTPEELKALLENAETSLDDKVKAIMDLNEADKKGLTLKNQELIAAEKKIKDAQKAAEDKLAGTNAEVVRLTEEIKKNSPEDRQKLFDAKVSELEAKQKTELETLVAERDKYRQAHVDRVRSEAVADGIKDLKLIPAYKEAFIARVMAMNNFSLLEPDGNAEFLNSKNQTIQAAMREFANTAEGKNFIENQNTGGAATGGNPGQSNSGAGAGNQVTREQFSGMSATAQMEFLNKGGKVVNP